jgi:hypothetical protein
MSLYLNIFGKKFSSQIYSKVNLKFQKQFKFSSDKQYKTDRDLQSELQSILKDINFLTQRIKNESPKTFLSEAATGENLSNKASSILSLQNQLQNLQTKAQQVKQKLQNEDRCETNIEKGLRYEKEKIIRRNLERDVFSSNYNFQNHYLNPISYINKYPNYEAKEDRLLLRENQILENNLEKQIQNYNMELINSEIGSLTIDQIALTDEATIADSDCKIVYDAGVENTRVFETTNLDDDFSNSLSDERLTGHRDTKDYRDESLLSNSPDPEFNRDDTLVKTIRNKTK